MDAAKESAGVLSAQLARLRREFDQLRYYLPDALLEFEIHSPRLLYMNQMAFNLFGYSAADLQRGIAVRDLFGDEQEYQRALRLIKSYTQPHIESQIPYTRRNAQYLYEFTGRRKDGTHFRAETQSSFIVNERGIPVGLRTIVRDVSGRYRTEEALRLSEERHTLSLTGGQVGLWDWDLKTNDFYLSPSLNSILGFEEEELPNEMETWLQHVHPDDRERVKTEVRAHLRGQTDFYEIEHRIVRRDGSIRWILSRGRAWRDEEAGPYRMAGSVADITDTKLAEASRVRAEEAEARARTIETVNKRLEGEIAERKRAEAALRASEERYRALFEDIPSMYFTVDTEGKILFANQFGAQHLQYAKEELQGEPVLKLFHEDDHAAVRENLQRCVKAPNRVHKAEFRKIRKDGSVLWVKEVARAVRNADGNLVVLIVCEDISEIKRAERERQQLQDQILHAQKLESLGVLAGGLAHDFNNLLAGILGNAGLALIDLPESSPVREHLEQIKRSALRAADLTKQLLAYAGKGQYNLREVILSRIIQEMGDLLNMLVNKKAKLEFHLTKGLPPILADPSQVRQVIMNLVTNAVEAIEGENGCITICTSVQKVDSYDFSDTYADDHLPSGAYVYMDICDNGHGIDETTKKKMFDPFFSTKFTGRGLGLAAALGIVRAHHGAIRVHSKPEEGSSFRVFFPTKDLTETWVNNPATDRPAGKILVVDDEEAALTVAKRILEKFGYSVLTARDGQVAVQVFQKQPDEVAAVLLDITMPGMSGEDTFRELRNIRNDVPVILSSGYDERSADQHFRETGATAFLQKPYQPRALIDKIREVSTKA